LFTISTASKKYVMAENTRGCHGNQQNVTIGTNFGRIAVVRQKIQLTPFFDAEKSAWVSLTVASKDPVRWCLETIFQTPCN
jgi:hypothetical protein